MLTLPTYGTGLGESGGAGDRCCEADRAGRSVATGEEGADVVVHYCSSEEEAREAVGGDRKAWAASDGDGQPI